MVNYVKKYVALKILLKEGFSNLKEGKITYYRPFNANLKIVEEVKTYNDLYVTTKGHLFSGWLKKFTRSNDFSK